MYEILGVFKSSGFPGYRERPRERPGNHHLEETIKLVMKIIHKISTRTEIQKNECTLIRANRKKILFVRILS